MSAAKPFAIPEEEFLEEYVRPSSGPGGQHQNKTENGVRLQWNVAETAVLTDAQKERLRVIAAPYHETDKSIQRTPPEGKGRARPHQGAALGAESRGRDKLNLFPCRRRRRMPSQVRS